MGDVSFEHVIRTRRTTRSYREEPVPEAVLQELVELATLAPSGMNSQPWRFSIITSKEVLREVSARVKQTLLERKLPYLEQYEAMFEDPEFSIFWEAPALIVIQGQIGNPVAVFDCILAAENLILAAHARGLGSCYMGFLLIVREEEDLRHAVGIAPGYEIIAPIVVGYSDAIPQSPPERDPAEITWVR